MRPWIGVDADSRVVRVMIPAAAMSRRLPMMVLALQYKIWAIRSPLEIDFSTAQYRRVESAHPQIRYETSLMTTGIAACSNACTVTHHQSAVMYNTAHASSVY